MRRIKLSYLSIVKTMKEKEMQELDFTKYRLSRKQTIRLNCLDCMAFSAGQVRVCSIKNCPLHPYRLGRQEEIPLTTFSELKNAIRGKEKRKWANNTLKQRSLQIQG